MASLSMARIQHIILKLCPEVRSISIGQPHQSRLCQTKYKPSTEAKKKPKTFAARAGGPATNIQRHCSGSPPAAHRGKASDKLTTKDLTPAVTPAVTPAADRRVDDRHRKVGHLFQGRYKAILSARDAYLLELVRYIHSNPYSIGTATGRRARSSAREPLCCAKPHTV
jgi:hypothetical protein